MADHTKRDAQKVIEELKGTAGYLHQGKYSVPSTGEYAGQYDLSKTPIRPTLDDNGRIIGKKNYRGGYADSTFWSQDYKDNAKRYNELLGELEAMGAKPGNVAEYSKRLMETLATGKEKADHQKALKEDKETLNLSWGFAGMFTSRGEYDRLKANVAFGNNEIKLLGEKLEKNLAASAEQAKVLLTDIAQSQVVAQAAHLPKNLSATHVRQPATGESLPSQPLPSGTDIGRGTQMIP